MWKWSDSLIMEVCHDNGELIQLKWRSIPYVYLMHSAQVLSSLYTPSSVIIMDSFYLPFRRNIGEQPNSLAPLTHFLWRQPV